MFKILITNIHSVKNKGDEGIVLGLITGLKKVLPQSIFAVVSRYPEVDYWNKLAIKSYEPLLVKRNFFSFLGKIGELLNFIILLLEHSYLILIARLVKWGILAPSSLSVNFSVFYDTDLVISKGGSFFREPNYARNLIPFGIIMHLNQIAVPIVLGKKVVLSAQSFGPINNPLSKILVRRWFNKLVFITVRDSDSKIFLEQLGIVVPIHLVADSAFLVEKGVNQDRVLSSEIANIKKVDGTLLIGCTVRNWSNRVEFENYLNTLGKFFKSMNINKKAKIVFMPQVIGPSDYENDLLVSKMMVARFGLDAYVVESDLSIENLINLYAQMDFFVATRLHSAIYALKAGVPVVAVAYEPKTIGIFKDLDLSEFVLDIRSIDKVGLENKFGRLSMEREKFKLAITKALISANKNINLIADLLK